MENIIVVTFKIESQAYQAFSEIKRDPYSRSCIISQMVLVEKQNGQILPSETFDTGVESGDDTFKGGLLGGLVGILGGPIGILLGGSMGVLVGSFKDAVDVSRNTSLLEKVLESIRDGEIALVAFVQETNQNTFDSKLQPYDAQITRFEAVLIQEELEEAELIHKEMEKRVRAEIRATKSKERKEKTEEIRKKIKNHFTHVTKDFQ